MRRGGSPFFEREAWHDIRERLLVVGGYCIKVQSDTGKVCIRLHRETVNRLKRFCLEWANRRDVRWWESWFWNMPLLPFAGVCDDVFSVLRFLNASRKDFRQPPVEWRRCVRKSSRRHRCSSMRRRSYLSCCAGTTAGSSVGVRWRSGSTLFVPGISSVRSRRTPKAREWDGPTFAPVFFSVTLPARPWFGEKVLPRGSDVSFRATRTAAP